MLLAAGGWEPGMRLRPPPPPSEQDSAPRVSRACLELLCLHGLDIHQSYIIVTNYYIIDVFSCINGFPDPGYFLNLSEAARLLV